MHGAVVRVTATVGVIVPAGEPSTVEAVLRDAELALSAGKRHGERFEVFDPSLRARADERLQLERDLRGALEADAFDLHYQPIVDLAEDRVVAVEALLRWDDPHRGPTAPAEFVPAAEDAGLIVPIGRVVLHRACRQLARWRRDHPDLTVNVDLSARQLADEWLFDDVLAALDGAGLPRRR